MTENQILLIECCALSFLAVMTVLKITRHKKGMDKKFQTSEVWNRKTKPFPNSRMFMCFAVRRNTNLNSQAPNLGMALLKRYKLKREFRKL